ncbi:hypothetical protein [Gilvibacter sediminis]|uniref:hypothetical protein n=1 Tax=Gilvibacter sediminis TaxID=379071 RepID=UPI0023509A29|nr:hypothetical protein [Gilvibacter sediminis]MDC7998606.1 hypothetical protein [Gilvibacter sediminis]
MTVVKLIELITGALVAGVFSIFTWDDKSEPLDFDLAVNLLQEQGGYANYKETLAACPLLFEIDQQEHQIALMYRNINSLTGGPAPNPNQAQQAELANYRQKIDSLKAKRELNLLQLNDLVTTEYVAFLAGQ